MKRLYVLFLLWFSVFFVHAQVDTVYQLTSKQIEKYLRPSVNQYLVFIQPKNNPEQTMTWIWSREVRFVKDQKVIEIEQKWYASDTTRNRYVYSKVNASNFLPIYHYTKMTRGIEAFDFYNDKISGSDSITNNTRSDFKLTHDKPFLNWELDLEIFPLLNFKEGRTFAINFYHPGAKGEPKLYAYRVIGEEVLQSIGSIPTPCWKLRIDYNEKSWAIFYISKKSREVLKMEEDFGSGVRYKVKLSNAIPVK